MDNATAQVQDNGGAQTTDTGSTAAATTTTTQTTATSTGWKSNLSTDLRNSPMMTKFEDTPEGLNKAFESHSNLEKLLGHEKVPIPKDANDVEGWNRFSKAMGIPDKAEGYGLPDAKLPDDMQKAGIIPDKNGFAEIAHSLKLTPSQAKGLWEAYNQKGIEAYAKAKEAHQKQMVETVNTLKGKWGDAYQTNVELGQMVINKFSGDQETNDYITSILSKDARGVEFLAKIGEQFAENKVGEFQIKKFSLDPEQAQEEIDRMVRDLDGPYMNQSGKWTDREHEAAIARVNQLRISINRARG